MSWSLNGHWYESCSCKMVCPCNFGPAEPDQGWCSAVMVLTVDGGNLDSVDLSGAKAAIALEAPGDFVSGVDRARLYVDDSASPAQADALERIFGGKLGGPWEAINTMIKEWLPSSRAQIEIDEGDKPVMTVGSAGRLTFEPITTPDGRQTSLVNGPVVAAFEVDKVDLGRANGTAWTDPDLRAWESLGYGGRARFSWKA